MCVLHSARLQSLGQNQMFPKEVHMKKASHNGFRIIIR